MYLIFSTLLVPYYVGFEEIKEIAKYLAELDKDLPYSLLVFHPDYKMEVVYTKIDMRYKIK